MMPKNIKIIIWIIFVWVSLLVGCAIRTKPAMPLLSPMSPVSTKEQFSGVPPVTDTPDPNISPIIISEVINQDDTEIIIIKNIGNSKINLHGMALLNPVTMDHIFLPDKTLLPGSSFKIYNGRRVGTISDGIKWLDTPILRQSGDYIVLLNPAGRAIWYYVKP